MPTNIQFHLPAKIQPAEPPKTPPSTIASRLNSTSTPISNNVSGSHSFSSEVKDRMKMNVELAKEMSGHFLGAMPPHAFLERFLPLKHGLASLDGEVKGSFDGVGNAKSERAMYKPFVDAVKPFVQGITFIDTHSNPDTERDKLAPDIAGYDQDNIPDEDATTDFSKMSIFVELKHSEDVDPFCDPYDPLQPQAEDFQFERDAAIPVRNRGQIGSYSAALCGSQFRVHLFSVSICGKTARFIRWDRSGAIVSRQFNYIKKPQILANFFWRYCHLDRHQQGYDPTVSPVSVKDVTLVKLFEQQLQDANPQHREFRKMMVPDRVNPAQEKPFIISFPPSYDTRSPFSRATRAMLAFDVTAKTLVFLKDYWRADVSGMDKEGDIYAVLQEANVPNIAPFGTGNDIKDHVTITQTLRSERWACWTTEMTCLRQYRMTLDVIGHKLTKFSSSWEFVSAVADAMEAHDHAFFDAKILHRDISVGNILISDEGKGLLIDWDLCVRVDSEGSTGRCPSRTGTWQFMSAALLQDPSASHGIEDDRESSFYVLIWTALRYSKHRILKPSVDLRPSSPTGDDNVGFLRAFDEVYADSSGTLKGGHLKERFLLSVRSRLLQFDKRPKLDALLTDLNSVFKVRYELAPSLDQINRLNMLKARGIPEALLQDHVVYTYLSGREKLKKRGWLVETMRSYLTEHDWPDDEAEPQRTVPQAGSKRKMATDQANLDGRVSKKHSLGI